MSDFNSITSFVICDNLEVGGQNWPSRYTIDNAYLKYSNINGLQWHAATDSLRNDDTGLNDYLVMNQQKGGENTTISANTMSYLRAGPGQLTGGSDGKGTGLTYDGRGQITIGLTAEDTDEGSTDINIHGSSFTRHSSITDRELSFIGDKVNLQYPSSGEKLFQESPLSLKINKGNIFKKENGLWIDTNYKNETLTNKVFENPHISGDIIFPNGTNNVEYGINSGNTGVISEKKEISGIFTHHKGLDENSSLKENEYKHWTIETTVNNKKESNIIEEYNVGYQKLYGTFNDYNNPVNGENTFKYNDYYIGWNLSVSAYTKYTTSNNSTHIIRPGTVFKIVKSDPSVTYYETLTKVCKTGENTLFFENSYENYDSGTITIAGFADNTSVDSGYGTSSITLSNATTSFIPAKTNIIFTDSGNNIVDLVIESDVEVGSTTIILTSPSPSGNEPYNISIKPFNTSSTTLTKVDYSERIVDYTIQPSALAPDTTINNDINQSTTEIPISPSTIGTVYKGMILKIGDYLFKATSDTGPNNPTINASYVGSGNITVLYDSEVYIKSFTGETIIFNNDSRVSDISKNNKFKNLSKQDVGSTFYISTQNKKHDKGVIYGDRIGKMLGNRKLNIYHREDEGFYVGWNIYLWNTNIPLNNSLLSDIKANTVITFTNPLDSTDIVEVALGTDATTTSPNILTLANDTEKNLDGYEVAIKGFSSTVSGPVNVSETTVADETAQLSLTPNKGDIIIRTSDSTKYIYRGDDPTSMTSYTLLPSTFSNFSRVTLSESITSGGVLPDFSPVRLVSNSNIKYYKVITYDESTKQVTLISDSSIGDLDGYTINIYGIPENTTVDLPSGIIEGYNSRLNTIQVLLNNRSYTVDNNTFYCLKKGYTKIDSGETYCVNLDGNKVLNDDYYNNWKIEVESEKNNGFSENSSDYIITDYKKQELITDYNDDYNYSGVLFDNSTLPLTTKPVEANYFKDCRIVISSESDVQSSSSNYKGIITSHDASTIDTSKIVTGTVIEGVEILSESNVSKLTISPALTNTIDATTKLLVTSSSGSTSIVEVGITTIISAIPDGTRITSVVTGESTSITIDQPTTNNIPNGTILKVDTMEFTTSSVIPSESQVIDVNALGGSFTLVNTEITTNTNSNEIILTTPESSILEGGSVFMLTNMSNLVVQWDTPVPDTSQITANNNFYITYNNTDWNDTNKRSLMYKTLKAEHITNDSNENNTNTLSGFIKLYGSAGNTTTNMVELLPDLTGVEDLSRPSSLNNYYKGWKITLKLTNTETFNIVKYSGSDNIATLDKTIQYIHSNPTECPYILTKNLRHQEAIDDIFKINTYVTAVDTIANTLTLSNTTHTTTFDDFRTVLLSPPRVFKSRTTINDITINNITSAISSGTTITNVVTQSTILIKIDKLTTTSIPNGTKLKVGTMVFTTSSETSSEVIEINATY